MTIYGRVKGSNSEYAVVKKAADGKYLVQGDDGYDAATTEVTVEIDGGTTDNAAWLGVTGYVEGLPSKRTEKDDNNNLVTTEYEYQINETHYQDKNGNWQPISGSYFEYGDGIYKIDRYGDLEIANTYSQTSIWL